MARFEGKTAIVTGSSNGIGRGIAVLFAREGAQVTITGRNEKALEETRRQCIAAGACDSSIHSIVGDFSDDNTLRRLVDETVEKFTKIDILINNAGVADRDNSGKMAGFATQDMDSYDYILNINLRCVVQLIKLALPYLEKSQGEIVNISSIAGEPLATSFPFYGMSKIALDQLTRALSIEYIKKGIRVNCIKPGAIESNIMQKQGVSDEFVKGLLNEMSNSFMQIPAGYVGVPDDVANLAAFLCDRSQSRYIIGQCIVLDGGSSLINPMLSGGIDITKKY